MMDSGQEGLRESSVRYFTWNVFVSSTDIYKRCTYDTSKRLKDLRGYEI